MSVWYFVCPSWKYNHGTFKQSNFGFRYVNSLCEQFFSKQKLDFLHRMRSPHKSNVRRYTDLMIDMNKYLSYLPIEKASDKIGDT